MADMDTISLRAPLRRTFWNTYDNLLLVIGLSLLWIVGVVVVPLLPVISYVLFLYAEGFIFEKRLNLKEILRRVRQDIIKVYVIFFLLIIGLLIIRFNLLFYAIYSGLVGKFLFGISFWIFVYFIASSLFVYPALVFGMSVKEAIRFSVKVPCVYPLFVFKVMVWALVFMIVEFFLPIMGVGILCIFLENSFYELLSKTHPEIIFPADHRGFRDLIFPWKI